jgi:endonuclease III related protein
LDPWALHRLDDEVLAGLIRPSGYFRVKTRRLKAFLQVLCGEFNGDLERMLSGDLLLVRQRLLEITGIGEETADSMLLYAGGRPVFVVDAYTRRILTRHGILEEGSSYGEIQRIFMDHLPPDAGLYNQYHALIVETAKRCCRKQPNCTECPLRGINRQGNRRNTAGGRSRGEGIARRVRSG